jgi:hypothetical protein
LSTSGPAKCAYPPRTRVELPPGSVDLLWSEGAIYLLGFEDGLRRFRPCLAPGGLAAVTECS